MGAEGWITNSKIFNSSHTAMIIIITTNNDATMKGKNVFRFFFLV